MTWYPQINTWYEDESKRTFVRTYRSQSDFQSDAEVAAQHGWSVVSVTELSQRAGCMRILALGLFTLIWRPKSKILVTYTRGG